MIKIAPSILAADLAHLADDVRAVEAAGADWIHVDVMDGRFVPNISFGVPLVRSLRPITDLPLDVHLMIVEPERYVDAFAQAGADIITVHVEACTHLDRVLNQIREAGCRAGVSLNPATPLESISYVRHLVDLVLLMTVNPGFGGQSLIPQVLPKVQQARALFENSENPVDIQVDGGVNSSTVSAVIEAGANVLVAGSAVFSSPASEYQQRISELRTAAL